jgi:hypothetical protein
VHEISLNPRASLDNRRVSSDRNRVVQSNDKDAESERPAEALPMPEAEAEAPSHSAIPRKPTHAVVSGHQHQRYLGRANSLHQIVARLCRIVLDPLIENFYSLLNGLVQFWESEGARHSCRFIDLIQSTVY